MRRTIHEQAVLFHRRGFGYYFVRTSWPSIITGAIAFAGLFIVHEWWYRALSAVLLAVWVFLVRSAYGAWTALRDFGDTIERLSAILRTPPA